LPGVTFKEDDERTRAAIALATTVSQAHLVRRHTTAFLITRVRRGAHPLHQQTGDRGLVGGLIPSRLFIMGEVQGMTERCVMSFLSHSASSSA
jgi:hypothetical protein